MAATTVLGRRALNRALLERQLLLRRVPRSPLRAVEHLVGVQAQEPQAPYVALWSRLERFDPQALSRLLEERAVVRASSLRATLHLVTAADCLGWRPLLQPMLEGRILSAMRRQLEGVEFAELARVARPCFDDGPLGVTEAARLVADRFPRADPEALRYAIAVAVPLVQVPPRGLWNRTGRVRNAPADAWLAGAPTPAVSLEDLVLRHLAAFGPATVADVRTWSGLSGLRDVVERLRPRLRTFRDERDRELFDVPDGALPDPRTAAPPRFLPPFENAMQAHDDRARVVDGDHRWGLVAGSRYVLADGFAVGFWDLHRDGRDAELEVRLSADVRRRDRDPLEAEARRLVAFLAPDAAARAVRLD